MADKQQDLIYINEVLNSSEISSLLSHPPYPLTLTIEELTKAPSLKNSKPKYGTSHEKIPRPSNPFMIYRKNYAAKMKSMSLAAHTTQTSAKVAKIWAQESKSVKRFFEILSLMAKKNHLLMHPNYKFQPDKTKKQKGLKFREFCLKKKNNKDDTSKSHNLTMTTRSITSKVSSNTKSFITQQETLLSPEPKSIQSPQILNGDFLDIDDSSSLFSYPWLQFI
ncbi:8129_t:CDS:1 [Scutellospora calospora]|uniref:8129_t:CDS:1 n=1 Tax=Scutellospora calospora TaxID=85575 RepID=A0ACA9JVE6_9GLOM|nr:8129_t:CDS:1 [Scutellospora calospora]